MNGFTFICEYSLHKHPLLHADLNAFCMFQYTTANKLILRCHQGVISYCLRFWIFLYHDIVFKDLFICHLTNNRLVWALCLALKQRNCLGHNWHNSCNFLDFPGCSTCSNTIHWSLYPHYSLCVKGLHHQQQISDLFSITWSLHYPQCNLALTSLEVILRLP